MLVLIARRHWALALLIALPLGVASLAVAPARAADSSLSYVTMTSYHEGIGAGLDQLWRTGTSTMSLAQYDDGSIDVSVSGGSSGKSYDLTFAAPRGQTLTPGAYADARTTGIRSGTHPGIDIYGDGRGCDTTSGHFTVLDYDPSLDRLWLTYVMQCGSGLPPGGLFGEIRLNEPATDPDVTLAPDRVEWPDQFPTLASRDAAVHVLNTGVAPLTVDDASITAGTADFALVDNGCGVVPVGGSCDITVGFTPSTSGPRQGTLTIHDSSAAGTHTVPLLGAGVPGHTTFALHSDPGDYVGAGQDYSYTPANADFGVFGTSSLLQIQVAADWHVDLEPDAGHQLVSGTTFTGASRYPFNKPSQPGLSVFGLGHGCNTSNGTFRIEQASYDAEGQIEQLRATFEQHCEGAVPALHGSLAYRADDPADPVPLGVAVSPDRSRYRYGDRALVTATLSTPAAGQHVSLYATPLDGTRALVGSGTTDATGRVQLPWRVSRRTTFEALDTDQSASLPGLSTVPVAAVETVTFLNTRGHAGQVALFPSGGVARIRSVVSPAHPGQCVLFPVQRYANGRWRSVGPSGCYGLSSASTTTYRLASTPSLVAVPLRVRAEWLGDDTNAASHSVWKRLRFTR